MNRVKQHSLALLVAALLALGCATSAALESESPSVIYYAAVQDYNIAKAAALVYIEQPSTPLTHAEAILKAVETGDFELRRIESLRQFKNVSAQDYTMATWVLLDIRGELQRRVNQ